MDSLRPEPKKSKLGRFRPETKMRGRWFGRAALACAVGSFVSDQMLGWIFGLLFAVSAVILGVLGLDSRGRGVALAALILGALAILLIFVVQVVGPENFTSWPE